jgi:ubiquinone/menaquinone biosynthesis C-methylase UbiE
MNGGDYDEMPPHYTALQRIVNSRHLNGQLENASDWASAEELAACIEAITDDPKSILVVGCRTGYELTTLKRAFPDAVIWGVDIVPEFIEKAVARGNARIADMHDLPYPAGHFEWVVCVGTLEHAYNVRKAASELLRVTERYLYVTADLSDPNSDNVSTFTFSRDTEEWLALFPHTRVLHQHATESGLYLTLEKV